MPELKPLQHLIVGEAVQPIKGRQAIIDLPLVCVGVLHVAKLAPREVRNKRPPRGRRGRAVLVREQLRQPLGDFDPPGRQNRVLYVLNTCGKG